MFYYLEEIVYIRKHFKLFIWIFSDIMKAQDLVFRRIQTLNLMSLITSVRAVQIMQWAIFKAL